MALQRQRYPMPAFVEEALNKKGLMKTYLARRTSSQRQLYEYVLAPTKVKTAP